MNPFLTRFWFRLPLILSSLCQLKLLQQRWLFKGSLCQCGSVIDSICSNCVFWGIMFGTNVTQMTKSLLFAYFKFSSLKLKTLRMQDWNWTSCNFLKLKLSFCWIRTGIKLRTRLLITFTNMSCDKLNYSDNLHKYFIYLLNCVCIYTGDIDSYHRLHIIYLLPAVVWIYFPINQLATTTFCDLCSGMDYINNTNVNTSVNVQ